MAKIRRSIRRGPTFVVLMKFGKKTFDTAFGCLVIRNVIPSDAKALNGIINELRVNRFVLVERPVSLKSTRERIKGKGKSWFAAVLGGKVMGSIDLSRGVGRSKHVSNFGISFSKKVHGKGIAQLALNAVFEHAKKAGVELISSRVFSDNKRGRAFYKKMGFKEVGILKNHLKRDGKYFDDILIVKKL